LKTLRWIEKRWTQVWLASLLPLVYFGNVL
jgi:hypothetical protein